MRCLAGQCLRGSRGDSLFANGEHQSFQEGIGLIDHPDGLASVNRFAGIVGKQADAFDLIERPAKLGGSQPRFDQMFAECADQAAVGADFSGIDEGAGAQ